MLQDSSLPVLSWDEVWGHSSADVATALRIALDDTSPAVVTAAAEGIAALLGCLLAIEPSPTALLPPGQDLIYGLCHRARKHDNRLRAGSELASSACCRSRAFALLSCSFQRRFCRTSSLPLQGCSDLLSRCSSISSTMHLLRGVGKAGVPAIRSRAGPH